MSGVSSPDWTRSNDLPGFVPRIFLRRRNIPRRRRSFTGIRERIQPTRSYGRWQRRLDPLQGVVCGGCHLTRDPVALAEAAGFTIVDAESGYVVPGPGRPWGYVTRGRALRA